jgi:hypothetical protein
MSNLADSGQSLSQVLDWNSQAIFFLKLPNFVLEKKEQSVVGYYIKKE